jgi:hypothetical protein
MSKRKHFTRREILGTMGGVGAAFLIGCGTNIGASNDGGGGGGGSGGGTGSNLDLAGVDGLDPGSLSCIVTSAETEGRFFVDEKLNRSCTPLEGAQVDVWHASAEGVYSDEPSGSIQSKSTVGETYLRGYQLTDAIGQVAFTTIYPGWYMGRTIHIHFKVRTFSGGTKAYEFTSQLFIDDAMNDVALAAAPYKTRGARSVRNATHNIYGSVGGKLLLAMQEVGAGYAGVFRIGLNI